MDLSWQAILFYLMLIDSIGANLMSFGGGRAWYQRNFRIISRYLPITKGWTIAYLALVLYIGYLTFN